MNKWVSLDTQKRFDGMIYNVASVWFLIPTCDAKTLNGILGNRFHSISHNTCKNIWNLFVCHILSKEFDVKYIVCLTSNA